MSEPRETKPSLLDRALNVVAETRPGEGLKATLLLITLFLLFAGYYALKTAREGLILGDRIYVPFLGDQPGTEVKIGATGVMALLMLGVVPAYGELATRVNRKRLLDVTYALVVTFLGLFFVLDSAGYQIGLGFFVWLGIVNMLLPAQFWSYANDLYTAEQGKRLFAIIAIGGTAGAFLGPQLKRFSSIAVLLPMAAALLIVVIVLLGVIDRLAIRQKPAQGVAATTPLGKDGGFQLVLRDRYLFLIGVSLVLLNLVNTTGEFILGSAFTEHAERMVPADAPDRRALIGDMIGGYYADFFTWVNGVGFVTQTLLASRVIKYGGIRMALFVLPTISLLGYSSIGLIGGFALIRIAKLAENSTDYSLNNTVRQALFLPTSREAKYKAKAAIDTFFVRFGDMAAALVVLGGIRLLHLGPLQFAVANVGVVVLWLLVAAAIARRHKRLEPATSS